MIQDIFNQQSKKKTPLQVIQEKPTNYGWNNTTQYIVGDYYTSTPATTVKQEPLYIENPATKTANFLSDAQSSAYSYSKQLDVKKRNYSKNILELQDELKQTTDKSQKFLTTNKIGLLNREINKIDGIQENTGMKSDWIQDPMQREIYEKIQEKRITDPYEYLKAFRPEYKEPGWIGGLQEDFTRSWIGMVERTGGEVVGDIGRLAGSEKLAEAGYDFANKKITELLKTPELLPPEDMVAIKDSRWWSSVLTGSAAYMGAITAGSYVGGPAIGFLTGAALMKYPMKDTLIEKGVEVDTADTLSTMFGLTAAGIENIGGFKTSTGSKMSQKGFSDKIASQLTRFNSEIFNDMFSEGGEELIQHFAEGITLMVAGEDIDIVDWMTSQEALEATVGGAGAGALFGGGKAIASLYANGKTMFGLSIEDVSKKTDISKSIRKETALNKEEIQKPIITSDIRKSSKIETIKEKVDEFSARLHRTGRVSALLGKDFKKQVFDPINNAKSNTLRQYHSTIDSTADYAENLGIDIRNFVTNKIEVAGIEMTQQERTMVYIYSQNENARNSLINANSFTNEQINKIAGSVTQEEIALAKHLQEEVARYGKKANQIWTEELGHESFLLEDNYFPISRDFNASERLNQLENQSFEEFISESMFSLNGNKAKEIAESEKVRKDFIKERQPGSKIPLNLNLLEVFDKHIKMVTRFNNFRMPIENAQNIVNDPKVQKAMSDANAYYPTLFKNYLNQEATGKRYDFGRKSAPFEKIAKKLRHNWVVYILGASASVVAKQPISISNAISRTGFINYAKGLNKAYSPEVMANIKEYNPQIYYRLGKVEREMRDVEASIVQKFSKYGNKIDELKRADKIQLAKDIILLPMKLTDKFGVLTSYSAALEKYSDFPKEIQAEKAEAVIRETQPWFAIETIPEAFRSNEMEAQMTTFQTMPNQMLNDFIFRVKKGIGTEGEKLTLKERVSNLMLSNIIPIMLNGAISKMMYDLFHDDEKKKKSDWAEHGWDFMKDTMYLVPYIGATLTNWAKGKKYDITTPALDIVKEGANLWADIFQKNKKGKSSKIKKDLSVLAGMLTGTPGFYTKFITNYYKDKAKKEAKSKW